MADWTIMIPRFIAAIDEALFAEAKRVNMSNAELLDLLALRLQHTRLRKWVTKHVETREFTLFSMEQRRKLVTYTPLSVETMVCMNGPAEKALFSYAIAGALSKWDSERMQHCAICKCWVAAWQKHLQPIAAIR